LFRASPQIQVAGNWRSPHIFTPQVFPKPSPRTEVGKRKTPFVPFHSLRKLDFSKAQSLENNTSERENHIHFDEIRYSCFISIL